MKRHSCFSCSAVLFLITLCSAMPSRENGAQTLPLLSKEGTQLYPRFHHSNPRSSVFLTENAQESINKKRSAAAFIPSSSIQRAIPEHVPTAFVHSSLGEFKEIPEYLQLDSLNPQKRENSPVFGAYNTRVFPRREKLFNIVNARESAAVDSLVLQDQNVRPIIDDHIPQKEITISEINNFQDYESSPQIQSFSYDNADENANIVDPADYALDEEEVLPLEEEISIHLVNSDNFEDDSSITESLQEESPQEIIYLDLNGDLLNNHNLEETHYVDYPESDIPSEQHAGHIFHETKSENEQNTQDQDPSHKTTGTVNQDELVDGNLEQRESPNLQMNIIQEGQRAVVQRLEPTLIFSNVSPYKTETQRFAYPFSPRNQFATNTQNQIKGVASENSVTVSEKEETKHTLTSVNSETFPSNGEIHTVNTIQKREQTQESHNFVPSYLGEALKSQESLLLTRGRSLGGFEAQQNTKDKGFSPGKLEGGFVPSNFFKLN